MLLALCLALLSLWVKTPGPPTETAPRLSLEDLDIVRAADVLSDQVHLRERKLTSALHPGDEDTLVQLLTLQAEAAQLQLGEVRFASLHREGLVQPVEAQVQVHGGYYDLPIFIDGLYRQSRIVHVRRVAVESDAPMSTQVTAQIEVRFFRPVTIPASIMAQAVEDLPAAQRAFAVAALTDAARLEAMAAFEVHVPDLARTKTENRQLVLHILPSLVRKLAASPMDWAAAEFAPNGDVRMLSEPG